MNVSCQHLTPEPSPATTKTTHITLTSPKTTTKSPQESILSEAILPAVGLVLLCVLLILICIDCCTRKHCCGKQSDEPNSGFENPSYIGDTLPQTSPQRPHLEHLIDVEPTIGNNVSSNPQCDPPLISTKHVYCLGDQPPTYEEAIRYEEKKNT